MTDNILDRDSMMTTSYIDNIYYERISNPLLNTSYPLDPSEWSKYAQLGSLKFSGESIAFYLHIPFCRHLCKFCEYTRMPIPDAAIQMMYIDTLGRDIYRHLEAYPHTTLYGLDIGGGTPFALCDDAFDALASLINDILQSTTQCSDFEPSIEGTFQTLSQYKIEAITKVGVKRLSLGLQSSSKSLMQSYNRESEHLKAMVEAIRSIHIWGIEKINIDVMYGLPGQTKGSIEKDLQVLKELSPEQVTVYEFRCNQVNRNYMITPEERFKQYYLLYEGLTSLGYIAEFGQNTFSKSETDKGLSSYLRHRMIDGWQYKGFGISSQSMSSYGISYNLGKNENDLTSIISNDTFESGNYYYLPRTELLNKFIAISGYYGGISVKAASRILGADFLVEYKDILQYLHEKGLISINTEEIRLTATGFMHYGAILSLFQCASR